ncbi:hypothetical protein LguiB_010571 [Lonicera macranthoides]
MSAAIRGILKDRKSNIVDGFAKRIQSSSPLLTEALAIREAYLILNKREITDSSIVGDIQLLISLSHTDDDPPWEFYTVLKDVRILARKRNNSFVFVKSSKNRAAHFVASEHV